jgi:hypothetical protein
MQRISMSPSQSRSVLIDRRFASGSSSARNAVNTVSIFSGMNYQGLLGAVITTMTLSSSR